MNKKELIREIAAKTGFSQKDITEVVEDMLAIITDKLVEGEDVNISGFGKFTVTERAGRKGINPRTLEEIDIPASRSPKFKAGSALKAAVAE